MTVIALARLAGEVEQAFVLPFPAATTYVSPDAMELDTATLAALLNPPPRLILATAGLMELAVTQFTPAMTCDQVPCPAQLRTRTARTYAFFATPYVRPAAVPATWVPCPLQSAEPVNEFETPGGLSLLSYGRDRCGREEEFGRVDPGCGGQRRGDR